MALTLTLVHFDGTSWSTTAMPGGAVTDLQGAWVAPSSIWAVGRTGPRSATWVDSNGSGTWTTLPSTKGLESNDGGGNTDDTGHLMGVWGAADDDVWVVERNFSKNSRPFLHWDGSVWTRSADTVPLFQSLSTIYGTSKSDIWAAGNVGFSGSLQVFHYDGSHWTLIPSSPKDVQLTTPAPILAFGPSDMWLGAQNNIWHYDGSAWTPSFSGSPLGCTSFFGQGAADLWATVAQGTIEYKGASWALNAPSLNGLRALGGVTTSDMWAVGLSGVAAHYNGTAWTSFTTSTGHDLTAVVGVPASFGK